MSHPAEADLAALIAALQNAGVEFIVVGGAAAVLHGAPTTTQDLDIVHRRTPENVARLAGLLEQLGAYIREPANRRLPPSRELLAAARQLNLSTALGPLDPLGELHDGRGYDELLPKAVSMEDGALTLKVIDLDTLIEIKLSAGRAKDKLLLPILIALRKEIAANGAGGVA